MTPFRVVLDTNCLVSALIFARGHTAQLRLAWQCGAIVPVVCKETITELLRVLGYPKFRLSREDVDTLLADFLPWTETVEPGDSHADVEQLRDRDDAVFIHLARMSNALYLVSGDKHLLELRLVFPELNIVAPADFLQKIENTL